MNARHIFLNDDRILHEHNKSQMMIALDRILLCEQMTNKKESISTRQYIKSVCIYMKCALETIFFQSFDCNGCVLSLYFSFLHIWFFFNFVYCVSMVSEICLYVCVCFSKMYYCDFQAMHNEFATGCWKNLLKQRRERENICRTSDIDGL